MILSHSELPVAVTGLDPLASPRLSGPNRRSCRGGACLLWHPGRAWSRSRALRWNTRRGRRQRPFGKNALLELADLAEQAVGTEITSVVRRTLVDQMFGGEDNDTLPERRRLGSRARQLVQREALFA